MSTGPSGLVADAPRPGRLLRLTLHLYHTSSGTGARQVPARRRGRYTNSGWCAQGRIQGDLRA